MYFSLFFLQMNNLFVFCLYPSEKLLKSPLKCLITYDC